MVKPALLAFVLSTLAAHSKDDFATALDPFIKKHCIDCHGPEKQKADLRLDTLGQDFTDAKHSIAWQDIADILKAGEMPPEKRPRPEVEELTRVIKTIEDTLKQAAEADRTPGRVAIRRLSHSALDHTAHDLLGIDLPLSTDLPADPEVAGFENMAATMETTGEFMHQLQRNASRLAGQAIVESGDPRVKRRFPLKKLTRGSRVAKDSGALVLWSSKNRSNCVWPENFVAPRLGNYRIRITAAGSDNRHELDRLGKPYKHRSLTKSENRARAKRLAGDTPRMVAVMADPASEIKSDDGTSPRGRRVGLIQVSAEMRTYELDVMLEKGENVFLHYISAQRIQNAPYARIGGRKKLVGELLRVEEIQVAGPLVESWPPELQQELLHEETGLETRVATFLKRAFRSPVSPETVALFAGLYRSGMGQGLSREAAMRHVVVATLCSPRFLYNASHPGEGQAWTLANRLSYFLWNSMPDETLAALAESGELLEPGVVTAQVRRLLGDPKSMRFVKDFTAQWLGLKHVGAMLPDPKLYPDYDPILEASMREESEQFFAAVLRDNLSETTFLDADFTMLNERLAKHYGIPGVTGKDMRRVPLPADSPRGGLLGQASILTITSNGTRTSPVVRGVWVLENILHRPPSPPPPDVEPIEPDVRGAHTIREMLEKHREVATCYECHRRIDAWGFAMENFDAVGAWRDHYRKQKPIDTSGTLADGTDLEGIESMKRKLLEDSERFTHALTSKLLSHALGHQLSFTERVTVDEIVAEHHQSNGGFADLIERVSHHLLK